MPYSILIAGWLLTSPGPLAARPLEDGYAFQHPAQASTLAEPAAAPTARQGTKPAPRRPAEVATHATTGIVKTVSPTALVITRRTAGKRTDTSFVLTPTTHKEGTLAAGSTVEIRYRTEGKEKIATAVSVEDAPQ